MAVVKANALAAANAGRPALVRQHNPGPLHTGDWCKLPSDDTYDTNVDVAAAAATADPLSSIIRATTVARIDAAIAAAAAATAIAAAADAATAATAAAAAATAAAAAVAPFNPPSVRPSIPRTGAAGGLLRLRA